MVFSLIAALMMLLVLYFLVNPILRKQSDIPVNDRREQNIELARQDLGELETSYKEGSMTAQAYEEAKVELEQGLYDDLLTNDDMAQKTSGISRKVGALIVAIIIPVGAVGMYNLYGNPLGIEESKKKGLTQEQRKQGDIVAMVEQLEKKMQDNPNDVTGWKMLGRTYAVMQRYPESIAAYEKSVKLAPNDPDTLLPLADMLGRANDRSLAGRPAELIQMALKSDPDNMMGLWMAGMAERQVGNNQKAIEYWKQLEALLEPGSEDLKDIQGLIVEAGGAVAAPASTPQAAQAAPAASATTQGITVTVDLPSELKARVNPQQTVFIYAKAMVGPPMPLAAARKTVSDLPITIVLDDSMAMMPQMKLSGFADVMVGARISQSGQPAASSGDLYAEQANVKAGDNVQLIINQLVP